ncbi:oxoglutarate dehydrogenase (succinyl-transferring), E1 component [Flavobacterium cauense R2A-7]|uniref:oxoglutarate dehydrogenase (succinyl-transferring) n=1 Tax=Flavobacterium cauense R2A-7 TaxID=1341154 RepID=V6SBL1_9FLAO|nr:2-oxoglutarate dehydrogenase E1 component [Flavobacterium cauense]ESU21775.1 oxoglutarate dehydrogenase (succinyl-transferring), E1 component [Flavobacterium cauense R2A-7]KGO81007.1 2-oxoglutarate dehydrogenase [Flavobacterium cauense R2A-7]TWI12922.1 2-oxoglutarate dehydrogenase E1 component [Flavobacterium cauense R2A-7]
MDRFSFLNAAHTAFFADLYDQYLQNPDSVEPSWRSFFQGFDFANEFGGGPVEELTTMAAGGGDCSAVSEKLQKEFNVLKLIDGYRTRGHLFTKTNPVRERRTYSPDLSIENFGLSSSDLNTVFDAARIVNLNPCSLQDILNHLNKVYCESIGIEYMYIRDPKVIEWIQKRLDINDNLPSFNNDQKKRILKKLNEAVSFENFLHTKYVGQKRFSLEGIESAIPALDFLIEAAADKGVEQFVMGMAHRGRLNVLANVFGKSTQDIFSEFDGKDYDDDALFDGDVKYHLGLTADRHTQNGKKINVNLAPNPSHLETVGAVIEGIARAKQDKYYAENPSKVLPIAVHGDAAVAGQGIVYEIIQMAKLDGYKTNGTIHVVLNNQVGFTTNYLDARSSIYCTDVAKVTLSPVLHVNADDAEAVVHAMLFALEYRMEFGTDVFIDLLGYRKYGHNEGDEPRFTQPKLYKAISRQKNPRDIYAEKLKAEGSIDGNYVAQLEAEYKTNLEQSLEESRKRDLTVITPFMQNEWKGFEQAEADVMLQKFETKVDKATLTEIAKVVTELPSDKKFISKITKLIGDRKAMFFESDKLDWAMGEMLAYGSLLTEGYDVRISGQDVERGTFSHRHAVIKVEESEEEVILLNHLPNKKGNFSIYNSHLSEYGVLGFEYGYALANPNALTIWEAQFGDFGNGAQIMIDQYISAAEDKWNNQNGIVMLLPHGYENQGAEHSSARMERFLQLCANHNMYVADCTTPANFFHLLRRQLVTKFRKPLVVFTPKSLLRHPEAVSSIEEFANGQFQEVIDDPNVNAAEVKTLVFCTGKFYYDVKAEREANGRNDVALVRVEQLFPLPVEQMKAIIAKYPNVNDYVWAQEEPRNMGAYGYMLMNFNEVKFRVASPKAYSAPAAGSYVRSKKRHAAAIAMVFDKNLFQ